MFAAEVGMRLRSGTLEDRRETNLVYKVHIKIYTLSDPMVRNYYLNWSTDEPLK